MTLTPRDLVSHFFSYLITFSYLNVETSGLITEFVITVKSAASRSMQCCFRKDEWGESERDGKNRSKCWENFALSECTKTNIRLPPHVKMPVKVDFKK